MASLDVTIKISGDKELIDKLNRFKESLMDFKDAMGDIGHALGDGDEGYFPGQVFASQGGVLGVTWPTNKMRTMMYKRKHVSSSSATTTLIRTGDMQKSFKYEATKDGVKITNTAPYFKYHQSGEPRTKMPYRPMIGINDDVKSIVKKILQKDMDAKVERLR